MTSSTPAPAVILVRPQLGENIGACARAMLNFGLTDMRLVAPRDGWPNPEAWPRASGADRVLDAIDTLHWLDEHGYRGLVGLEYKPSGTTLDSLKFRD